MCSGFVRRAVRWDGTSFAEELDCECLGVNADGLCCTASGIVPHGGGGVWVIFLGWSPKWLSRVSWRHARLAVSRATVTVAEDVGRNAVLQKCTQQSDLHPLN